MNNTINNNETIGQRIREARLRLGMTQEDLAENMYLPKSTISAYENDKIDIKSSVIVQLARTLKTTSDHLLGLTEDDPFILEAVDLLKRISNSVIREGLLVQMRALAENSIFING